ncbi:MAG: TolC family protein [Planctomycetes bacterium]|nr:TolC family protein [Planctomycetota bacterium]
MTGHASTSPFPQRSSYFVALVLALAACRASEPGHVAASSHSAPRATTSSADLQAQHVTPRVAGAPLTLADVVELALARNPDREAASARVAAASAVLARAEAAFWPTVGVQGSWVRSDAPSSYLFKHIDGHALPPGADFNDPGWFGATELAVAARWNLWNGGRDEATARAARSEHEARAGELRAIDEQLAAHAVLAVVDARVARELASAAAASIATVEAQLDETRARVERGAALRSDVLSLEVRLAQARESVLRSEFGEKLALAALRRLLSLDPEEPLALATGVTASTQEPATIQQALAQAYEHRPELESARHAADAARLRARAAAKAWLPRLDLEARGWADDLDSGADFDDPNYQLGLSLGFDVFDGGARAAARREADAWARALERADASAKRAIEFDVQQAWLALEEARARLDVTRAALAASEETLELVGKQFQAGSVVVTRFLEAESARTQAKSSRARAELDVERARLELARARGALIAELRGERR